MVLSFLYKPVPFPWIILICCVMFVLAAPGLAQPGPEVPGQPVPDQADRTGAYCIGAGDVLNIVVWKNADLTRQLPVTPDGCIHFPLIGRILAKNSTVLQLQNRLIQALEPYLNRPVVTVSVSQINSMQIYVTGKVNNPGRFMIHDDITVLQALAMAGGLTPYARDKKIRVLRKTKDQQQEFLFNYHQVSRAKDPKDLEQNIRLHRGDTIVVR